ncbi:MAG TPA: LysR family transcriptional regulator [Candidatus Limnocylindrales bacterium]|nr:LysR family transcriptional regulator [Candidatus Limnocylindrales bacterium]
MPDNWASVELKHLRALRAVARTGTFWAASEALSTSLSTVSDHIHDLEALVGQRLVERSRGRRTVSLTEAGRLLLGHADAIESRLRAAEADLRAYAAGLSGTLRVGVYQSVENKILPEVMRRFKAGWPSVEVELTEASQDLDLVASVERGALDLTFAIEPIPDGPFEVRRLMSDPYVLVAAAGSPLSRGRLELSDLDGLPMVGFQHGRHQDLAENFLLGRGVRPRVVFRTNDNGTVQAMVASGLGFALAPLLAVDENDPRVTIRELEEAVPPRVLVVVWHRDRYRPPAAAAFVDTAIAVAGEVEASHAAFLARRVSPRRRRGSRTPARGRRPRRSASLPA